MCPGTYGKRPLRATAESDLSWATLRSVAQSSCREGSGMPLEGKHKGTSQPDVSLTSRYNLPWGVAAAVYFGPTATLDPGPRR